MTRKTIATVMACSCGGPIDLPPPHGQPTTDGMTSPECEFPASDAALSLPTCDPAVTPAGPEIVGSGAAWHVPAGCDGPVDLVDGPVIVRIAFAPSSAGCPDGIEVESITQPTPPSAFAVSPMYEIRAARDTPCEFWLGGGHVQVVPPVEATGACGWTPTLYSRDGDPFADLDSDDAVYVRDDIPVRLVAARQCPTDAICSAGCTSAEVFATDEANCGSCEASCSAVCDGGECRGFGFGPGEPELPSFRSDGVSVYWSRALPDGGRSLHRLVFTGDTAIVEDFATGVDVHAWDTSPGAVAWIERLPAGVIQFQRRDLDAFHPTFELSFDVTGVRDVQPTTAGTVIVAPPPNAPLVMVPLGGVAPVELVGCFASSTTVVDVAADGADVLVLGEDDDPDLEPGDLWRCPLDGSPAVELLDDVQWPEAATGAWQIVPYGAEIFLVGASSWSLTPPGGVLDPPAVPIGPIHAIDGDTLYLPVEDRIERWVDGAAEPIVSGVMVADLAIASGHLVFADGEHSGRVVALPLP